MNISLIYQNLCKLLNRRGYTVPTMIPSTHFTVRRPHDNDVLLVFCAYEDTRTGVGVVRDMVKLMEDMGAHNAILITKSITSSATTSIHSLMASGTFITTIAPTSLLFDIFDHVDVPPHRLLSSEETQELLKERNLKLTQFPSIKMDDPVCRYLGGRPGDVFEITRNRPTVGQHLYYRKVVGGSSEQ